MAARIGLTAAVIAAFCASVAAESPTDLVDQNNRGLGLMGQFKFSEAIDVFQPLTRDYPDRPDLKVNLAVATLNRQAAGDEEAAMQLLAEALEIEPEHLHARYCTGLLLLHAGKADEAYEHFRAVADRDPSDPYAAYYVAQCLAGRGDRPEEALQWYETAIELDPYLRSGYYGASQLLRQQGKPDDARKMLEEFTRLADNPKARVIEFKYTLMGPKGEVIAVGETRRKSAAPSGPVFDQPIPLLDTDNVDWSFAVESKSAFTACDIDGDGRIDLFLPRAFQAESGNRNAVLIANEDGTFDLIEDHPLAGVPDVNAALWGDFDNDGLIDVYLCRKGPNQLWRRTETGWEDVTESTQTGGGDLDTVDGAFVDADHDGDLDLFLVNADGPNELLNNNRDGSFRPLASEREIAGDADAGSKQVLFADLENDRDLDLLVVNQSPPHAVYLNDRLWNYRPAEGFEDFVDERLSAVAAADVDADGIPELYGLTSDRLYRWSRSPDDRRWTKSALDLGGAKIQANADSRLALFDADGDGTLDLAATGDHGLLVLSLAEPPADGAAAGAGLTVFKLAAAGLTVAAALLLLAGGFKRPLLVLAAAAGFLAAGVLAYAALGQPAPNAAQGSPILYQSPETPACWGLALRDPAKGLEIATISADGQARLLPAGSGRHRFAALELSGKEHKGDAMRTNASGIGTRADVRVEDRWTAFLKIRDDSGPGQSRLPLVVGLGGAETIDFVSLEWPDGVTQSELALEAGRTHQIAETQRQTSSCPVLFVWDGSQFRFVTDLLGVGGIGYLAAPGDYAPPVPMENLLLPEGVLQPLDGHFVLKLTEPMEEICYLDSAKLVSYDLPPGWKMTVDERMHLGGPEPTRDPIFYRRELSPIKAVNDRGEDVAAAVRDADLVAAPVGRLDRRFIGRLENEHILELTFDRQLDAAPGQAVLIADGWVEYPYSQTMFAAWQADADYAAPTIEAADASRTWRTVHERFGYPAGMPRQMALPLGDLPKGTTRLRLRTNQEIYWDRLTVVYAEPCPQAERTERPLKAATLHATGFAERTDGPQRQPDYDYDRRVPLWDAKHLIGFYTEFGSVVELVKECDDALAIFGPGEEIELRFSADPSAKATPENWSRRYVLETVGWCKDRDLFTKDGDTVAPLPSRSQTPSKKAARLHEKYNVRYRD